MTLTANVPLLPSAATLPPAALEPAPPVPVVVSTAAMTLVLVRSPLTACATTARPTEVDVAVLPSEATVMTCVTVCVTVLHFQPLPQGPQGEPATPPAPQPPGPPAHGLPFHSQPVTV
jgi:hypothetical protein